jgi:hypothetical protein
LAQPLGHLSAMLSLVVELVHLCLVFELVLVMVVELGIEFVVVV